MSELVGHRLADIVDPYIYQPGAYGHRGHRWWGKTPNGLLCNLEFHNVVEHEDGTITVTPSIQVTAGNGDTWHGWLEHGVWRD